MPHKFKRAFTPTLNEKSQRTTLYKNNSGLSNKMKLKYINQDSNKPKSKCLKSATILIRYRCVQAENELRKEQNRT